MQAAHAPVTTVYKYHLAAGISVGIFLAGAHHEQRGPDIRRWGLPDRYDNEARRHLNGGVAGALVIDSSIVSLAKLY